MKAIGSAVFGFSCLVLVGVMVFSVVHKIQFERNCSGHLKHAAKANSIQLAEKELGKAISYLEEHDLVEGSTHAFYSTPATDLEFWYQNLKSAHDELVEFPLEADHLTVSNHLMKLRETLTDSRKGGSKVSAPKSIAIYPYQLPVQLGGFGGFAGLLAGLSLMGVGSECSA